MGYCTMTQARTLGHSPVTSSQIQTDIPVVVTGSGFTSQMDPFMATNGIFMGYLVHIIG